MRSHYNIHCSSFIVPSIISFHHNPWAHRDICPIWKKVWKFSHSSSLAPAVTAINKEPLPHYIKISELPNEWTSGPEFPRDDNCSNSHQTCIAWGSKSEAQGPLLTTDKFLATEATNGIAATNTTVRRKWNGSSWMTTKAKTQPPPWQNFYMHAKICQMHQYAHGLQWNMLWQCKTWATLNTVIPS